MAENYIDKMKVNGIDQPIQDTTSGFYLKPGTGIPSTDLASDVQTSLGKADNAIPSTEKGANGGVATLGNDGKIPSSQLPGSVDDVIELLDMKATAPAECAKGDKYYNTSSKKIFTATASNTWGGTGADPEGGKIYVNLNNMKEYRWGGSEMGVISDTIALGETQGTAYEGNKGKALKDKLDTIETNADVTDAENVKAALGTVDTSQGKYLKDDGTWATPPNDNTTYQFEQDGNTLKMGTNGGAKSNIYTPSISYPNVGYEVAIAADNGNTANAITLDGGKPLHIITLTGAVTSVAFATGKLPAVGHSCHVIFTAATATKVSIAHVSTGAVRYICPEGSSPSDIDVPAGGYAEIDLLRGADTEESNETISWIYVRGI